jgi:adenylate cyclase
MTGIASAGSCRLFTGVERRRRLRNTFSACLKRPSDEGDHQMNETPIPFTGDEIDVETLIRAPEANLAATELALRAAELNAWAAEAGLSGAAARDLFEGYCQRLTGLGIPLMRAYASNQTLHPQWTGYGYTWRREWQSVREQQFARGPVSKEWLTSPFYALIQRSLAGEKNPWLRRRLELGPEQRDFPALVDFHAAGATDYICMTFRFGAIADPSHGTGVVYSFTTDRPGGFRAAEIDLLRSTLPSMSLAMKAYAGYDIASGLLRTYLGHDAGSRVHSGAVERGSVSSLSSVLWYADLRNFTRISDVSSGTQIVEMLNDVFETLTASLRPRGGHVLKFIGDAMLATISFEEADARAACRLGLDAALEGLENVRALDDRRQAAGLPSAKLDIALHVGEVLYGNVGAADRLDFTVIGPAVNEVVRMEKLCDQLNRHLLFSSRFAETAGRCDGRLVSLGEFQLRGVSECKEIFGLRLSPEMTKALDA